MLTGLLPRRTAVALAVLTVLLCAVFAVSASAGTTPTGVPGVSGTTGLSGTTSPGASPQVSSGCKDKGAETGGVFTSPGPGPGYSNRQIGTVNFGNSLTLTCEYYNNVGQGKWYAELTRGSFGYQYNSYVWVQRLVAGQNHACVVNSGASYAIGSSECPLTNVN